MPANQSTKLSTLIHDVTRLGRDIVRQQWSDLSEELQKDAKQAGTAALYACGGAALLTVAGGLSVVTTVHLVQRITRLPLWASYGLVTGVAGVSGMMMLGTALNEARAAWSPRLSEAGQALRQGMHEIKGERMTPPKSTSAETR